MRPIKELRDEVKKLNSIVVQENIDLKNGKAVPLKNSCRLSELRTELAIRETMTAEFLRKTEKLFEDIDTFVIAAPEIDLEERDKLKDFLERTIRGFEGKFIKDLEDDLYV